MSLLEKMLVLDAERRVTAAEALAHPYFESLQDTEDEPQAQKYDESFDDVDRTLDEWKREWGPRPALCGWRGSGPRAPLPGMQVQRGMQQEVRGHIQALGLSWRPEQLACPCTSRPGPRLPRSPSEPLPRPLLILLGSPAPSRPFLPHSHTAPLSCREGQVHARQPVCPPPSSAPIARPLQPTEHPHPCSAPAGFALAVPRPRALLVSEGCSA